MRRYGEVTVFVVIFALFITFPHCTTKRRIMKEWKKDTINLTESATEYFTSLRWKDYSKLGAFIEDESQRIDFIRGIEKWGKEMKIDEVRVESVRIYKDRERGRVLATYTSIDPNTLVVHRILEKQVWYKKDGRWYIDLASIEKRVD